MILLLCLDSSIVERADIKCLTWEYVHSAQVSVSASGPTAWRTRLLLWWGPSWMAHASNISQMKKFKFSHVVWNIDRHEGDYGSGHGWKSRLTPKTIISVRHVVVCSCRSAKFFQLQFFFSEKSCFFKITAVKLWYFQSCVFVFQYCGIITPRFASKLLIMAVT